MAKPPVRTPSAPLPRVIDPPAAPQLRCGLSVRRWSTCRWIRPSTLLAAGAVPPRSPAPSHYCELVMGVAAAPYTNQLRSAWDVLGQLVAGSSSSLLHRRIRAELGLAYDLFCGNVPMTDSGVFRFGIGTSPADVDRVAAEARSIIAAKAAAGWSRDEAALGSYLYAASQARTCDTLPELVVEAGQNILVGGIESCMQPALDFSVDIDALNEFTRVLAAEMRQVVAGVAS